MFEREPNRVIKQLPGASRAARVGRAGLALPDLDPDNPRRQREWQTFDGNFVPPNLSYNEVPPCLAIGPYPQSRADVRLMKERGVTGVLNVQTDFDHQCRMINWAHMLQAYESEQLQVLPPRNGSSRNGYSRNGYSRNGHSRNVASSASTRAPTSCLRGPKPRQSSSTTSAQTWRGQWASAPSGWR